MIDLEIVSTCSVKCFAIMDFSTVMSSTISLLNEWNISLGFLITTSVPISCKTARHAENSHYADFPSFNFLSTCH